MDVLQLTPAYGRDYRTAKQVKEAWAEGKDFIIENWDHRYRGKPCNREGVAKGTQVNIRYARLTKVLVFKA